MSYVREFSYDGARERYRVRNYDPAVYYPMGTLQPTTDVWTDYEGDEPYGDFTVTAGTATNVRSFELGIGRNEWWPSGTTDWSRSAYYHGDQISTTRFLTDSGGSKIDADVYTAFGEHVSGSVSGPNDRYGYAGAWGYQSQSDFPYLHVGHRYYDPAIGRFLQRDPIGINGALNVYAYVDGMPTMLIDPDGLQFRKDAGYWDLCAINGKCPELEPAPPGFWRDLASMACSRIWSTAKKLPEIIWDTLLKIGNIIQYGPPVVNPIEAPDQNLRA